MKLQFCLILVLCSLLQLSASRKHHHRPLHRNRSRGPRGGKFDFLIFTQVWPPTSCYIWEEKSPHNQCNLPGEDEWTIHGIWPTSTGKLGPENCNSSLHFDMAALEQLRPELERKWIDVHKGAKPHEFWRHEWEKHGTCAVNLEPTNTEVKYFRKGLELLDTYDMKHVFAKAGVQVNQAYTVQAYLDAVRKILGKNAYLECTKDKKNSKVYIQELRICLDKQFQLIDCNGVVNYPSNCHLQEVVMYPGSVPDRVALPAVIQV